MLEFVLDDDQTLVVDVVASLIDAPAPAMLPASSLTAATRFVLADVVSEVRSPILARSALNSVPI
jgi:hypothetical protein